MQHWRLRSWGEPWGWRWAWREGWPEEVLASAWARRWVDWRSAAATGLATSLSLGAGFPGTIRHVGSGVDSSVVHARWNLVGRRRHWQGWHWELAWEGGARIARCVAGGLAGGFLGTVIYELAGAFMFPLDKTYQPLSETSSSRLLARLAVTLCVAVVAVLAAQVSRRKRPSPRPVGS